MLYPNCTEENLCVIELLFLKKIVVICKLKIKTKVYDWKDNLHADKDGVFATTLKDHKL